MYKVIILLFFSFSCFLYSDPIINEHLLKRISNELEVANQKKDSEAIKKYLFPDTKIIIDLDPALNTGETEFSVKQYMHILELWEKTTFDNEESSSEILNIYIDKKKNIGTVKEKSKTSFKVDGKKFEDISISEIQFGIRNGKVVIISMKNQAVSSGFVE
jgi:hypothetical protein